MDGESLSSPDDQRAMLELREAIRREAKAIVDQFYRSLEALPRPRRIIALLADVELDRLKSLQMDNLTALAEPGLEKSAQRLRALHLGHVHAVVGLTEDDLVHSHELLSLAVWSHVDIRQFASASSVLAQRQIRDLAWQLEGFTLLQEKRNELLLRVTRLIWEAVSFTDLIAGVTELLAGHDEIAGCWMGRPDQQRFFRYESMSGEAMASYLKEIAAQLIAPITADASAQSQGPTGRAWVSGDVEHCENFAADPRMSPWRSAAAKVGFRSSVAIPLRRPGGETRAILTFYSRYPGGFTAPPQLAFIAQIQTLLAFAVARLEQREGWTNTVPYEVRTRWHSLVLSSGLEMHYQPIQKIASGEIFKVEALARLRDGGDVLTPGVFLPAFSSDGLFDLFTAGLDQALTQQKRWREENLPMTLSVNLPSGAIGDERYYTATRTLLEKHRPNPHSVCLEILETTEVQGGVDVRQALTRFKEMGVRLAEDDLGSGYSGLSRLRSMPFDAIKIDRSLVSVGTDGDFEVLHFIRQLTRLGQSLGKQVIVEGVEDTGMLEAVAILGADAVQGYAVARPMPAGEFRGWLERTTPWRLSSPLQPESRLGEFARLMMWEEYLERAVEEVPRERRSALVELYSPPFLSVPDAVQRSLIEAAMLHGLRSPRYNTARARLLASFRPD